ncbi:sugar phosphate isomerase/epimerase [Terriglobus albidus]|uniref:Sugar phosphate isomerase/epimerase n=1 Tax=Terriglobus albidus TaxID=1592106 RepID=A0A5B9E860_9BACT|nr:sugar phosphate isomerase/epimerase family protein [Terriglobus albidus]QEE27355.1 sugar phosphate isomerase/epimerase [Terriglobus albidus]
MIRAISTHVFLEQRLHPGLLDALASGGAEAIEIFAARHHFDYTDRSATRELANWFRSNNVLATLHQPLHDRAHWSRDLSQTVNLIDPDKSKRIHAMDEIKRSLESADFIPFESIVLHLGQKGDTWSPRALENSLSAIEHIKAFAGPLGIKTLVETLDNDVTSPEHLLEILHVGHFDTVNICVDLGHCHLRPNGVEEALTLLATRIRELHLHDNQGVKDEHLWPGSGGIDWKKTAELITALPQTPLGVLEITHELHETAETASQKAVEAWKLLGV